MKKSFVIIALALLLQSCGMAVVSTLALASYVVYDHRNLETRFSDQKIIYLAYNNIKEDDAANPDHATLHDKSHIVITAFQSNALIAGQVPTQEYKKTINTLVKNTKGVEHVYNQLEIGEATSDFTQANDAWITTEVKTAMLKSEGLDSADIKALTEDSTVFLLGTVSPAQAQVATNTVRRINGVERVVTLFDYKTDDVNRAIG